MRNHLALSIASVAVLVVASGCSAGTHDKTASADADATKAAGNDVSATTATTAGTTLLRGRFAELSVALDNARALAIADDQTTYAAPLDAHGTFTLAVPAGASYRIVFANQLAGGGQVKVGHLSFKSGAAVSDWFGANAAGDVDLGVLLGNGSGGASSDHTADAATVMDAGRSPTGPKTAAASAALGAVNACLIWPSVQVWNGVDVGDAWADRAADTHALANATRDDDKNCAYWKGASGATVWGAPWSVGTNGEVVLAGGNEIDGGVFGGRDDVLGFGTGFYGGYFTKTSEGLGIGVSVGGSVGIDTSGIGAAVGGAASAISGTVQNVVNAADGTVQTAVNDADGTVQTAANDADGAVQTVITEADGTVKTIVTEADGTVKTIITDADGTVKTVLTEAAGSVQSALDGVSIGDGIVIGANVGVFADANLSNGWVIGLGAGVTGDACFTAASCAPTLSCVANACAQR